MRLMNRITVASKASQTVVRVAPCSKISLLILQTSGNSHGLRRTQQWLVQQRQLQQRQLQGINSQAVAEASPWVLNAHFAIRRRIGISSGGE